MNTAYFDVLAQEAQARPERLLEIDQALHETGAWSARTEWSHGCWMMSHMEVLERNGILWYRVSVYATIEMSCEAPSLEKATEFLGIFERMIRDLLLQRGCPDE